MAMAKRAVSKVPAFGLRVALLSLVFGLLAPWPSRAEDIRLMNVGVRVGFTGASVLGEEQQEAFQEYSAFATFGLHLGGIRNQAGEWARG